MAVIGTSSLANWSCAMRAVAWVLLFPLLIGAQTTPPTKKPIHAKARPRKAASSSPSDFEHIGAYMRHVALLYLDAEQKLLKARASNDTETAELYEQSVDKLEKDIKIDFDSD